MTNRAKAPRAAKAGIRCVLAAALLFAAGANADSVAIINVNVIPMTSETVIPAQTVVVRDGSIAAIGDVESVRAPEDAIVVDGTDRFLMPGFVEMHAHVTSTEPEEVQTLLDLFLANGVTTIRGMLGRSSHLELREDLAAGRIRGPRLITSGPSLNGNSVSGPDEGARMVREQHAAGYDFVKIHPGLSAGEFNAIADQANELGMPFAGHVPVSVGVQGALDKGIATIDHLDGYMAAMLPANSDPSGGYGGFFGVMLADEAEVSRLDALVAATVDAGVANVPTESLFEQLVNDEPAAELSRRSEMRFVDEATVSGWIAAKNRTTMERGFDPEVAALAIDIRRQLIRKLHEAGAVLLLGSDAPQVFQVPGFSLHHELELMVAAGLTPYEALATGTTAPAEFFGLGSGTVEIGAPADLVLLDANPLTDISNSRRIHGVVAAGRWSHAGQLLADLE